MGEVLESGIGTGYVLVLVAVAGFEQTNDAERLRESLDWGGQSFISSMIASHPAILVTYSIGSGSNQPGWEFYQPWLYGGFC
jgi:hypothetical protein